MKELERTFLAKFIPDGLKKLRFNEIFDIYIPKSKVHPTLRIRKYGDKYEMTKKEPINGTDSSYQMEQTINLTKEEFTELEQALPGKRFHKIRYHYDYRGRIAEIDVFQDELKGLVLVDFEFGNKKDKNSFQMPDFCLADVTQEKFTAGGMLCGKSYGDIEDDLRRFSYSKLFLK